MDETTLFSSLGDDANRSIVEGQLNESFYPLTLEQRCADWFLMKVLISGTMAGLISREVDKLEENVLTMEDKFLRELFVKCMDSWFKHHNSSDARTIGTENEEPTFNRLFDEHSMKYIYEVGLLQHNHHLFLGFSPDGIVIINGGDYDGEIGYVEIKTRCKQSTILHAEKALEDFGRTA